MSYLHLFSRFELFSLQEILINLQLDEKHRNFNV